MKSQDGYFHFVFQPRRHLISCATMQLNYLVKHYSIDLYINYHTIYAVDATISSNWPKCSGYMIGQPARLDMNQMFSLLAQW